MDERTRVSRAAAFGGVADVYARARPHYPPEALRWLVGSAPLRVLDLGAGTGRATEALLADGHRVVAVDSSAPMLTRLLARHGVPAAAGTAEQIPLRDRSVHAVVVAQAFHWFDPEQAVPEVARVLAPGGVVGIVWNIRDETVPWVRRLSRIIGAEPDAPDPSESLARCAAFGAVQHHKFRLWQRLDRAELIDLVASRSYVAMLQHEERQQMLDEVGALYDSLREDPLGLALPYDTLCFRAVRS